MPQESTPFVGAALTQVRASLPRAHELACGLGGRQHMQSSSRGGSDSLARWNSETAEQQLWALAGRAGGRAGGVHHPGSPLLA